jgi:acetylornithine/succinyldiaminopimelate/putrescine aminotransferase
VIAVVEEMERIDACRLARERGARLRAGLEALPGVSGVRGEGLLLGAVLSRAGEARAVAARLLDRGLIVNAVTPDTLRFAPPLTVSEPEVDEALLLCAEVLS